MKLKTEEDRLMTRDRNDKPYVTFHFARNGVRLFTLLDGAGKKMQFLPSLGFSMHVYVYGCMCVQIKMIWHTSATSRWFRVR